MTVRVPDAETVASLYDLAARADRSSDLLERLCDLVGMESAILIAARKDNGGQGEFWSHALPDAGLAAYAEHYWQKNVWAQECARQRIAPGSFISSDSLLPRRAFERTEWANDFLNPYGINDTIGAVLNLSDDYIAIMGCFLGDHRRFDERRMETYRGLLPHVAAGVRMRGLLAEQSVELLFLREAAGRTGGLFLVDRAGCVAHMNPVAERLCAEQRLVRSSRDGLALMTDAATVRLADAVRSAAATARGVGDRGVMSWREVAPDSVGYLVEVMPFVARDRGFAPSGCYALVRIVAPSPAGAVFDVASAVALYGLTPAEAAVLKQLMAGHSTVEVADLLGRSVGTVRNQLKAVFRKTATGSQGQLLSLLSGIGR